MGHKEAEKGGGEKGKVSIKRIETQSASFAVFLLHWLFLSKAKDLLPIPDFIKKAFPC